VYAVQRHSSASSPCSPFTCLPRHASLSRRVLYPLTKVVSYRLVLHRWALVSCLMLGVGVVSYVGRWCRVLCWALVSCLIVCCCTALHQRPTPNGQCAGARATMDGWDAPTGGLTSPATSLSQLLSPGSGGSRQMTVLPTTCKSSMAQSGDMGLPHEAACAPPSLAALAASAPAAAGGAGGGGVCCAGSALADTDLSRVAC
jgi:hypothetical protein